MSTPRAARLLAVLLLILALDACGQKGALYLPEPPKPSAPQDAPPADEEKKKGQDGASPADRR